MGRISAADLLGAADPHLALAPVQRRRVGNAGDLQRGHRCLADGALNVALTAINVFYIVRLLRGRHDSRTFEVVEISPNEDYLKHLLYEFDADIQHFNPGFSGDDAARAEFGFLILIGAETVGLVLARNAGEGSAQVDLDYVVPRYQGFTLGEFVYRPGGPFAARGYRRVIAPPGMQNAGDYLADVGFRPEGDAMVLDLA